MLAVAELRHGSDAGEQEEADAGDENAPYPQMHRPRAMVAGSVAAGGVLETLFAVSL